MTVLSAVARRAALATLALSALACLRSPATPRAATHGAALHAPGAARERGSFEDLSLVDADRSARQRRLRQLDSSLHPIARALVHAHGAEQAWARDGGIALSSESCTRAVGVAPAREFGCSLLALGDGVASLLIMRAEHDCRADECFERSWVFLSDLAAPLALPPRRISDYRALRADLSQERASALWLAGFRSAASGSLHAAQVGEDDQPAQLAAYSSCTLSPNGRELVCRSTAGDVLAFDPRSGAPRLVVRLGIPAADLVPVPRDELAPVWWTSDGRLAMRTQAHHSLCGERPCALIGLARWPSDALEQAQLVRAEEGSSAAP